MESEVLKLFKATRSETEELCKPLKTEDYSVQPFVDVSPPKWHLAHSTWFYEQFILVKYAQNYKVYDDDFSFLFNSYYNNVGERVLRPNRGNMTRPVVNVVYEYRNHVTTSLIEFLKTNSTKEIEELVTLGINHEQQHQELLAYDIKYILGHQPTFPSFETKLKLRPTAKSSEFIKINEGIYDIGFEGNDFSFDNELGRHKIYLHDFEISNKLITNEEYIAFIEDGGYQNFNLWHAEGLDFIENNEICAPMYWHKVKGEWMYYQFNGLEKITLDEPVMNISFYEAFAFAEWKGMRLPTEFEWEVASDLFDWGDLWEWTNSAYLPYPNFSKQPGALGEYNGKFMVSQMVLRGGSFATAQNHSRKTYRNFFHPSSRWQFGGIRLAK
jgi:ergothioneine biosynthesis protein EgtB